MNKIAPNQPILSLIEFETTYCNDAKPYLFRGQNKDFGHLLPSLYRKLWQLRPFIPEMEDLHDQISQKKVSIARSRKVATELVAYYAQLNYLLDTPIFRFFEIFFPTEMNHIRSKVGDEVLPYILGSLQHIGLLTPMLDFSWNPLVAAWFACFDWKINNYVSKNAQQPIIYIHSHPTSQNPEKVFDLRNISKLLIRPSRQEGAVIFGSPLKDYSSEVEKIYLDPSGAESFFEARGLSREYFFPDDRDVIYEFNNLYQNLGYDIPEIFDWLKENKNSYLHHLFKDNHREIIISLCKHYDAFFVKNQHGENILSDFAVFDFLKLNHFEVSSFLEDAENFEDYINICENKPSPMLINDIVNSNGDPYKVNWEMTDDFPLINTGSKVPYVFANLDNYIKNKVNKTIKKHEDNFWVDWSLY